MKTLLLTLITVLGLTTMGCVAEGDAYYPNSPGNATYGNTEYCDSEGNCRDIEHSYWYYGSNGETIYYDNAFGYWVSPYGYYTNGGWVVGFPAPFVGYYRPYYHQFGGRYYRGGFHGRFGGGGGYRHGGGGFHGGGHGGRR